jgi:site-specific recombinase XerD
VHDVLRVTRGELEMYVRQLESRGYAAATVARRFGTVATFYKYAVIDGVIPANPADAVSRPKVAWEGQKRTVLHPLEFPALLSAARTSSPNDHALVCMLGMLGLRVSEACNADITDIRYAVREAIDSRSSGPILRTRTGRRMDRAGASRALIRVARAVGISHLISPHGLRRTFCTTGLVAGIDQGYAVRDASCRPAHDAEVRHGECEPRPARRTCRCRLPGRHEHRLTRRPAFKINEPSRRSCFV